MIGLKLWEILKIKHLAELILMVFCIELFGSEKVLLILFNFYKNRFHNYVQPSIEIIFKRKKYFI